LTVKHDTVFCRPIGRWSDFLRKLTDLTSLREIQISTLFDRTE
jgi:hypothetical protein